MLCVQGGVDLNAALPLPLLRYILVLPAGPGRGYASPPTGCVKEKPAREMLRQQVQNGQYTTPGNMTKWIKGVSQDTFLG